MSRCSNPGGDRRPRQLRRRRARGRLHAKRRQPAGEAARSLVGQLLFDRSARVARPTPFAWRRRRWRATSRQGSMPCARGRGPRVRPRAVGAIASVQTANLPQALRTVRDRHPDLRVEVSLADFDELIAAVKAAVSMPPCWCGHRRAARRGLAGRTLNGSRSYAGAARRSGGAAAGAAAALRADPLDTRSPAAASPRSMCGRFPRRGSS